MFQISMAVGQDSNLRCSASFGVEQRSELRRDQWNDRFLRTIFLDIEKISLSRKLSKEEKKQKLELLLKTNAYLDSILDYFDFKLLGDMYLQNTSGGRSVGSQIIDYLKVLIDFRANLSTNPTLDDSYKDLNPKLEMQQRMNVPWRLHSKQSFEYKDLKDPISLTDFIDFLNQQMLAKPKDFEFLSTQKNLFFSLRLYELPDTEILVFPSMHHMSNLLSRASRWIESKTDFTIASDFLGNYGAGHDLRSQDLQFYTKNFLSSVRTSAAAKQAYVSRKLEMEIDFFTNYIQVQIEQKKTKVFLAVSLEQFTVPTISHEILHALFFNDRKFKKDVMRFWYSHIDDIDKKQFADIVNTYYDIEQSELMANEFMASVLQYDSHNQKHFMIDLVNKYRAKMHFYLSKRNESYVKIQNHFKIFENN